MKSTRKHRRALLILLAAVMVTVAQPTLAGGAALDHTIDLAAWEPGKEYTYNISITPMEIKFKPEVTTWEPLLGAEVEL